MLVSSFTSFSSLLPCLSYIVLLPFPCPASLIPSPAVPSFPLVSFPFLFFPLSSFPVRLWSRWMANQKCLWWHSGVRSLKHTQMLDCNSHCVCVCVFLMLSRHWVLDHDPPASLSPFCGSWVEGSEDRGQPEAAPLGVWGSGEGPMVSVTFDPSHRRVKVVEECGD